MSTRMQKSPRRLSLSLVNNVSCFQAISEVKKTASKLAQALRRCTEIGTLLCLIYKGEWKVKNPHSLFPHLVILSPYLLTAGGLLPQ